MDEEEGIGMSDELVPFTPTVVVPPPPAPERWSPVVTPEVNELLKKIPVFNYRTGQGFYMSKREHLIVHTWLLTRNIHECTRVVNACMPPRRRIAANGKVSKSMGVATVWRWLKKRRIAEYVTERQKIKALASDYSEEQWKAEGIMYKDGHIPQHNKMSWYFWKELGKALGYYKESGAPAIQLNQQISFVQQNGQA